MHRDLKPDNVALELPIDTMLASSLSFACQQTASPSGACDANGSDSSVSLSSLLAFPQLSFKGTPANAPSACIIDFGMARAFDVVDDDDDIKAHMIDFGQEIPECDGDSDEDVFPVRAVSARVSIPLYCAPEIALSLGLYDSKADMWAGTQKQSALYSIQISLLTIH